MERPVGSSVRPTLHSANWSFENEFDDDAQHTTRARSIDVANQTVIVEASASGPYATHDSMMEAVQATVNDMEHELSSGILRFKEMGITEGGERERGSEQGRSGFDETFESFGDPPIEFYDTDGTQLR